MLPVSAAGDFECGADGRPLQRLTVQEVVGEVQVLAAGLSVHIEGSGGLSQILTSASRQRRSGKSGQ